MPERKKVKAPRGGIVVRLTKPQWDAIVTTVSGELESLTAADEASGLYDDLQGALEALTDARKRKAARKKLSLEQGER